jgi:8-oxo-dGTP pyrophosphatase MutT (NUDIX family)
VRVVLLRADDSVLLVEGHDPARPGRGWYWFTLGGGVEPGESEPACAVRELREECGLEVDAARLGPVRRRDRVEFDFEDVHVVQRQSFYVLRVGDFEVDTSGWVETERRAQRGVRWWTVDELRSTADTVYPPDLAELVAESIRSGWV